MTRLLRVRIWHFPLLLLGLVLALLAQPATAQTLLGGRCEAQIRSEYAQQVRALREQSNKCHWDMWGTERARGEPVVRLNTGMEECSWHGYQSCAGPISGCPRLVATRNQVMRQCDLREAEARRQQQEQRSDETDSPVGVRALLGRSFGQIGGSWAKDVKSHLLGANSPFATVRDFRQLKVNEYLHQAQKAGRAWGSANAAYQLSKVMSGGAEDERRQAAFQIFDYAQDKAISATGNPAAGLFATYSFMILRNFQTTLIAELNEVAARMALLRVDRQIGRAQEDIAFAAARRQWAEVLATGAAGRDMDYSMSDLVADFQAKARQIANANAQSEERAREAARAKEQADQQARAEAERRTRAERADQERRAQARPSVDDGLGPYPPNCRNKRSFDACAIGGRGCSGGNRIRCAPICRGLCDD